MSDIDRDPLEDPPPATQASSHSNREYVAVFLFEYDIDTEQPFSSVTLDNFQGSDFPFEVINGHMGLSDRLKPRSLSRLPGRKFCIFAKCEEGRIKVQFIWFFIAPRQLFIFIYRPLPRPI